MILAIDTKDCEYAVFETMAMAAAVIAEQPKTRGNVRSVQNYISRVSRNDSGGEIYEFRFLRVDTVEDGDRLGECWCAYYRSIQLLRRFVDAGYKETMVETQDALQELVEEAGL